MVSAHRCNSCESVLQTIDSQISKANQYKENQQKLKLQVEQQVSEPVSHPHT